MPKQSREREDDGEDPSEGSHENKRRRRNQGTNEADDSTTATTRQQSRDVPPSAQNLQLLGGSITQRSSEAGYDLPTNLARSPARLERLDPLALRLFQQNLPAAALPREQPSPARATAQFGREQVSWLTNPGNALQARDLLLRQQLSSAAQHDNPLNQGARTRNLGLESSQPTEFLSDFYRNRAALQLLERRDNILTQALGTGLQGAAGPFPNLSQPSFSAHDLSSLAIQARVLQLEREIERERRTSAAAAAQQQQITDSLLLRMAASNAALAAVQPTTGTPSTSSSSFLTSGLVTQAAAAAAAANPSVQSAFAGAPAIPLNSAPRQTSAAFAAAAPGLNVASLPQASFSEAGGPTAPTIGSVSLSLDSDKDKLSPYQILMRKQLEFFVAVGDDVDCGAQGRKKQVYLGQVGVRCRHCAGEQPAKKRRGAVYFPARISGVYQAAQNMAKTHLLESCGDIDQKTRQKLQKLYDRHDTASGGKAYWAEGCYRLGVYETEHGLRLRSLPHRAPAT